MMMTACGGGSSNKSNNSVSSETPQNEQKVEDDKSPKAAFAQFGMDIEEIKPNLATPSDIAIQYGNKVDKTVYYRKATWTEKSDTDIDRDAGNAYNERMFNYCKSISADGKCYKNKTGSDGGPTEIASIDELTGFLVSWSYKVDGIWVDVYMEWSKMGNDIGITLQGSGSY